MKIDLTKEEWEFLKKYIECANDIPLINHNWTETIFILENIYEKLGDEWKDDECVCGQWLREGNLVDSLVCPICNRNAKDWKNGE